MTYFKRPVLIITLIMALFMIFNDTASAKRKGWLGVSIISVNEDVKDDWELSVDKGVLVTFVINDSPADKAGIKKGDVILKYEGRSVRYSDELMEYVRKTPPGEKAKIEIDRNGKSKKFQVTIERNRRKVVLQSFGDRGPGFIFHSNDSESGFLGVDMYDLTDGLREYFKVEDDEGVLVVNVIEDSPAEKAGFKSGDVIVKVDKRVIEDSDDLRKAISRHEPDEKVKIEYIRNKKKSSKTVTLGERENFNRHNVRIFRNRSSSPRGNFFLDLDDMDLNDFHFDMNEFEFEMERFLNGIRIDIDGDLKELKNGLIKIKKELKSGQTFI